MEGNENGLIKLEGVTKVFCTTMRISLLPCVPLSGGRRLGGWLAGRRNPTGPSRSFRESVGCASGIVRMVFASGSLFLRGTRER